MAQMRVFVSHSHEDDAFCQSLVAGLRGAGADVWYDEHNLGSGQLMEVIQRELGRRPVVVLILSKAAFASRWVRREIVWAYELLDRDPSRLLLPVTAGPIEREDFSPEVGWLFLHDFKRIEASGYQPYPTDEAIHHLLHTLALTPANEASTPAVPKPSESADDLLERAKALWAQQRYDEMLPFARRATQLAPDSFDAWFNLGRVLWGLKQHSEALFADERALVLDSTNVLAWNNKGATLADLNRYTEALTSYEHALTLDPNYATAWYGKGAALRALNRSTDALAAFERALTLDPSFAFAWYGKGLALRALGRTAEAEAAERRAQELSG